MCDKTIAQVLHYLISNAGDGVMTKLFLLKTVYLADRYHLRKYGRLITGANYVAMRMGPVASQVKKMIESDQDADSNLREYFVPIGSASDAPFRSVAKCSREFLSDTEIEALSVALAQFNKIGPKDIVNYTHMFPEWKNCEEALRGSRVVQMNIEDFFLPVDEKIEYCSVAPELVEMNLDFYRGED